MTTLAGVPTDLSSATRQQPEGTASTVVHLEIVGPRTVHRSLIAAFLAARLPAAELSERDGVDARATAVHVAETGRWAYFAADWDPSEELAEAIAHGAAAVIALSASEREVDLALGALFSPGTVYIPPAAARWMARATLQPSPAAAVQLEHTELTSREEEVLHLVASGLSNEEIADQLGISVSTVRAHLHAISLKFRTPGRTGLIPRPRRGATRVDRALRLPLEDPTILED